MSDAPVNPDSGREGRRRVPGPEQREHHRGSRRLGFVGRYLRGSYIDPSSNIFDYGLFVAILIIALLIARTWQGSSTTYHPAPPVSSGIAADSSPSSGTPAQVTSSVNPSGSGQGGPNSGGAGGGAGGQNSAGGGASADGANGQLDSPDTVLAAGKADAGELENDKPPPPARHGKTAPKAIHKEPATYTNEARFARFKGKIIVVFTVDEEGAPQNIELTAPAPYALAEPAIAAVRKWRYQPATQDGKPVNARLVEEVPFR